jgi:crossover junction endodeoxyribonuclease RuvC
MFAILVPDQKTGRLERGVTPGKQKLIIIGIDPGLANTGWGIVEECGSKKRALAYGCISTPADIDIATRLKSIHDQVCTVIERYQPSELGIESVYFGSNSKSAMATGQARGAALVAAANAQLTVGEYSPRQIKQAVVGTGTADKEQVQYMVRALLGLDHTPTPDHAADALAAAICHTHLRRMGALASTD